MSEANVSREPLLVVRGELATFGRDAELVTRNMKATLSQAVDEAEFRLDQQIALVDDLRENLARLRRENNKLHAEHDQASRKLKKAQQDKVVLNNRLRDATNTCNRIHSDMQAARMNGDVESAHRIEIELRRAQERCSQIRASIHQNERLIKELGKTVRGLKSAISYKESEIATASHQLSVEENRLAHMRACLQEIRERAMEFSQRLEHFLSYAFEKNERNISTVDKCIEIIDEYDRIQL